MLRALDVKRRPSHFERFDLAIDHLRGSLYTVRLDDSPDGRRKAVEVDFDGLEEGWEGPRLRPGKPLRGPTRHLRRSSPECTGLRQLGERLFRTLFRGPVAAAYRASLWAVRGRGHGLRVRLAFDQAPSLAALPWEALWDPTDGAYFCDRGDLVVVRWLRVAESPRASPRSRPPLRLLALLPDPRDEEPLDGAAEWTAIRRSLARSGTGREVAGELIDPPTLEGLRRRLDRGSCDVLHVVAHGLPGGPGEGGLLSLENDVGGVDEVGGAELVRAFEVGAPPRLVVLNICHGAECSGDDPFDGMAQTLLRRGVEAVVAMGSAISDAAAICFATAFYDALAEGQTVEAAMVAARRRLGLSPQRHELATPVLYMQGENVRLFARGGEAGLAGEGEGAREPHRPVRAAPPPARCWCPLLAILLLLVRFSSGSRPRSRRGPERQRRPPSERRQDRYGLGRAVEGEALARRAPSRCHHARALPSRAPRFAGRFRGRWG